MNKTLNDFFNAIDDGASKDELLEIIEYMDNPNDLYNAMTEVAGDHPDDVEIYNAASRKYRRLTERSGSRKGSRKGAEKFATSGFDKGVKGITGTLTSKPVMNTLKRTTGTEDQKNQIALEDKANSDAKEARADQVRRNNLTEEQRQAEDNQKAAEKAFNDHKNKEDVEKRTQEVFKQNGVEYPKKERKGTGPLCDLGNISGKGSRPENLSQISSGIVAGRKRSIRLEGEYTKESRKGSRKGGSPTHDQVYDILNYISDATSVTNKYFDGYNKEFEDLTQDELTRLASELISTFPDEYKEYSEETIGSYKGSRKGSVYWDKFIGWEDASNYADRERFMSVFRDVTGHDYLSDYGEEFDDEDKAQRILDILDGHLGSRNL